MANPAIVDRGTALPAFPRYERLALRAIGINQFAWLRPAPMPPGNDPATPLPRHRRQQAG
jgi:hypothetical protein